MGKTTKPLCIAAPLDIVLWDEMQALKAQGHDVRVLPDLGSGEFDLILGPECSIMDVPHREFLKFAIEAARARRYPKETKNV